MRSKITILVYKDPSIIDEVMDMIKANSRITKKELYSKLSGRKARSSWDFIHWLNDRIDYEIDIMEKEITNLDREVKSFFTFKEHKLPSGQNTLIAERNYDINKEVIPDGYKLEVILR